MYHEGANPNSRAFRTAAARKYCEFVVQVLTFFTLLLCCAPAIVIRTGTCDE